MGNAWTHLALSTRSHWGNSVEAGSFIYSAVCTTCGLSSGGLSRPIGKSRGVVLDDALANAIDDSKSRVFSLGNGGALALAPFTRSSSCTHDRAFLYIYEATQSIHGRHTVDHDAVGGDNGTDTGSVERSSASFGVKCGSAVVSGLVSDHMSASLDDARLVLRPGWAKLVDLLFVHAIDMKEVRMYINAEACRLIASTRRELGDALESAASTFFVHRSTLFNLD